MVTSTIRKEYKVQTLKLLDLKQIKPYTFPTNINIKKSSTETHKQRNHKLIDKTSISDSLFSMLLVKKLENHQYDSEALSASLHDFRSKISNFIDKSLFKPESGSETLSLSKFNKCFELIHFNNSFFAYMVSEIDYPMSKWSFKAIDEYLNYTLILLDLLNAINSSVTLLNQAKLSMFHAINLIEKSIKNLPVNYLRRIQTGNLGNDFKLKSSSRIEEVSSCSEMERTVLEALVLLKKSGLLTLGFVLSGLCGDAKPYTEIRNKYAGGVSDDPLIKSLDLRFCERIMVVEEVKDVNDAVENLSNAVSTGRSDEAVRELKRKLEVMENMINCIEKEANKLFSEVLATRNKLLDSFRVSGKSSCS